MTGPEFDAIKKLAAHADDGGEVVQITKRDLRTLLLDAKLNLWLGFATGAMIGATGGTLIEHLFGLCRP
jgi:hypothetical protein